MADIIAAEAVIDLEGVAECLEDLKRVKYDISKKVVGKALRDGGLVYERAMQAEVPIGRARYRYPGRASAVTPYKYSYRGKKSKRIGTTRRAIVVRSYQDEEGPTVLVRVTRGIKATWDAFYATFVHWGTPKKWARSKKTPNKILQPNEWAKRAADAAKPRAMEAVAEGIRSGCRELGLQDGD